MKRGRLPLTALRSFEAAGRHLSFSRAAEELFVSQAAISRQIRELEAFLRQPLFHRLHRRVELTDAGQRLLDRLVRSFDDIDRVLSDLAASPAQSVVRVSVEPSLAAVWLVPRLNRFRQLRPDIDVSLEVDVRPIEFRSDQPELALRFSAHATTWPRTEAERLVSTVASVVPMHFSGQNGRLFHLVSGPMNMAEREGRVAKFVGKASLTLRLSLLIREFARLSGKAIDVRVGDILTWNELEPLRDRKALLDRLHRGVFDLAPVAPRGRVQFLPRRMRKAA
ncbi:MAG: LysR family transcriptional regulator [Mesorhizobium sp.]|uniref:LysR family transcriptional regulator n=1 Tax=Mesorhizobium sp. TaxID=1871066 RepID=UPI000FE47379|nr:LysR family transcriptional regulator [Mesorhizobium sp.]RWC93623.1 MAG: LysR family transcriptional regulator [Mesorhizobium sp.]